MTPAEMQGLVIGPVAARVDLQSVDAFVTATGDDPDRWHDEAPPGYAAALLFAVASDFLGDPRIAPYLRSLVHVDQQFSYPAPIPVDVDVIVTGEVERVRMRGGTYFVTFAANASVGDDVVLESRSTFLMSDQPAAAAGRDGGEPGFDEREHSEMPESVVLPPAGAAATLAKSASRADLVRYAAATGDLNPLHWDHAAARAAGLDGVVVHGLLMLAWMTQHAASFTDAETPVAAVKVRFRNALRPAMAAVVETTVKGIDPGAEDTDLSLRLTTDGTDVVTGTATIRLGGVTR
ncbi:MAG: MaoC/PaaZ C-terminal domain-containing protein [Actinomycetota bacterium]